MSLYQTKYFGATNTKCSKVQVKRDGKVVCYVEWDYALNIDENHLSALRKAMTKAGKEETHAHVCWCDHGVNAIVTKRAGKCVGFEVSTEWR